MQEEKTPFQYSKYGNMIKSFLHTKIGAKVGYFLKIKRFNRVGAVHTCAKTGKQTFLGFAYNSRVDKGGDLIASLITGAAQNSISSPLPPKYIALSTSSLSPAHTDTTLTGETSATGLGRALGTQSSYVTPTTLDGACSYTVTKTFTNTSGGSVTVVSAALFDAVSTGNMFVEANLSSSAVMATNDTLAITWGINL